MNAEQRAGAVAIAEDGGRLVTLAGFLTDVLVGIPTIVIGAFVWAMWVAQTGSFSGLAGSAALAIIMLPLIIRGCAEMLRLVPDPLREASAALGVTQARTIISVVLPSARYGLITAVMLAVARAMGETVTVTHHMQQAARISDITAFFTLKGPGQPGHLVEASATSDMFSNPAEQPTQDYITGKVG